MTAHYIYLPDTPDDTVIYVTPGDNTLHTLQTLVEGLVDLVAFQIEGNYFDLWVNDEGLYRPNFSLNFAATMFAGRGLVGPAVITRSSDDGETLPLYDDDKQMIMAALGECVPQIIVDRSAGEAVEFRAQVLLGVI